MHGRPCSSRSRLAASASRPTSPAPSRSSPARMPATSPARPCTSTAACTCPDVRRRQVLETEGRKPASTTPTRIPYTTHRNSLHRSQLPMSSIEERVKKIVVEQLGVKEDEVSASASFVDDLGADSLDTVELVMALEEEFECEIPDEEAEKITSVQQAIDYIKAHVKA